MVSIHARPEVQSGRDQIAVATPEQISEYYKGYPDPKDSRTWGKSLKGVRNHSFSAAQAAWKAIHGAAPLPSPIAGPSSPGSGMAAARAGDSTAHGGTIGPVTTGQGSRVLIGNMPAACMGDPHVCPMFSGPKAHGGGTITKGSSTVHIGGKPAARVSDLTVCTSEPGQVAKGEMSVLIGDLAAASSGNGTGGTAGSTPKGNSSRASSNRSSPATAPSSAAVTPEACDAGPSEQRVGVGTHWISIELVDESENPVVGERYRIRLTDGTEIQGALDANGRSRIVGLNKPGGCDISFPRLDLAAWHRRGTRPAPVSASPGSTSSRSVADSDQPVSPGPRSRAGHWRNAKSSDCISSIAVETGHFWQTIWDHPANAELKRLRGNPNVLRQNDSVFVPDMRPKSESGHVDQHHKFVRLGEPSKLLLQLLEDDEPRANMPWILEVDGKQFNGTTDDDGNLAIPIRGNTQQVLLRVGHPGSEDSYELNLGEVEPIETESGVAARLENLGYLTNRHAMHGQPLADALRAFQSRHGLAATGRIDRETREQLLIRHGS